MNGNAEKENVGEKLKATGFIGRYIRLSHNHSNAYDNEDKQYSCTKPSYICGDSQINCIH